MLLDYFIILIVWLGDGEMNQPWQQSSQQASYSLQPITFLQHKLSALRPCSCQALHPKLAGHMKLHQLDLPAPFQQSRYFVYNIVEIAIRALYADFLKACSILSQTLEKG